MNEMITICPKCGHQRSNADDPGIPDTQCPACGIFYFKYLNQQKSGGPAAKAQPNSTNQAKKELEIQQKKKTKERNRPVLTVNFMVAGCNHENRQSLIGRYITEGDKAILQCDKNNRFSRHAVKVLAKSDNQVGFVPEAQAQNIAEALDANLKYEAIFTKIIGQDFDIPVVDVKFYRIDADYGQSASVNQAPAKIHTESFCAPEPTETEKLLAYQELAMHKTNHILHLLISVFTMGIWLIPWFIASANNTGERNKIRRKYRLPVESDGSGLLVKFGLALFLIVIFIRGCSNG